VNRRAFISLEYLLSIIVATYVFALGMMILTNYRSSTYTTRAMRFDAFIAKVEADRLVFTDGPQITSTRITYTAKQTRYQFYLRGEALVVEIGPVGRTKITPWMTGITSFEIIDHGGYYQVVVITNDDNVFESYLVL